MWARPESERDTVPEFSLVSGGLVFRLLRRAKLAGTSIPVMRRRMVVTASIVWMPLLVLSFADQRFLPGGPGVPFLQDIEAHARFLIALPLLIAAEAFVDDRVSPLVHRFVERRIIAARDLPAFSAAVRATTRACESLTVELALIGVVYVGGVWLWRSELALADPTWYARPVGGHLALTLAGHWYAFVSIPIFQFLLLRWYVRMTFWFHLLWRISRLPLHLAAAHPDGAGGIGFLGNSVYAFSPILFAQGTLLSGLIATRILFGGQHFGAFNLYAAGLICAMVVFVLGPLLMFTPQLDRVRRKGVAAWGLLAMRELFAFEAQWRPADTEALAHISRNFSNARAMRVVPFARDDVVRLVAVTAAPLLPLVLTMFSLREVLKWLVKVLF